MTDHAPNIADLINIKRASGYDGEFEALLRRPWYCPHCRASKTILKIALPIGRPELGPGCVDCDKEGVQLVSGDHAKLFRRILDILAPYDRSGTA